MPSVVRVFARERRPAQRKHRAAQDNSQWREFHAGQIQLSFGGSRRPQYALQTMRRDPSRLGAQFSTALVSFTKSMAVSKPQNSISNSSSSAGSALASLTHSAIAGHFMMTRQ